VTDSFRPEEGRQTVTDVMEKAAAPVQAKPTEGGRRVANERRLPADLMPGSVERRHNGERRRSLFSFWPRVRLGGLPVVAIDRKQSAIDMVDAALQGRGKWRYPAYLTSTNGEVTYACGRDAETREMFMQADAIHADGMPHVFASRLLTNTPLPERVATTDLFFDVCEEAQRRGASMFMLGATPEANKAAADLVRSRFPELKLVGARNGYFSEDEEEALCADIVAKAPDILWVSMGVPREQTFITRNRHRLTTVGIIKTSGGLFDFVSGKRRRAPLWMQAIGLEWLWRASLEPGRLGARYLRTNPYALFLLFTRSGK
jgi:N-acetylglucosaminyldiphosphoundecaprenol N-acetyl-beta-D-mannosaminyltransferase